jgi:uncharacterized protein (TIGR02145 family)
LYEYPYGNLYNWYSVADNRNICPAGWHVPSDAEFTTLITYLGGESVAGGKMKVTGTTYWNSPNVGATNENGFSALPGGSRGNGGSFSGIRILTMFWNATEGINGSSAWLCELNANNGYTNIFGYTKSFGASIRCLRD